MLILRDNYFSTLRIALAEARSEVQVLAYVINFQLYKKHFPSSCLVHSLIDCHAKGLAVNIVLDSSPTYSQNHRANFFTYRRLIEKGLRIRMQQSSHPQHQKLFVIDRRFAFAGSHNITDKSLQSNWELSFFFDDAQTVRDLAALHDSLWYSQLTIPWERRLWPRSKTPQSPRQTLSACHPTTPIFSGKPGEPPSHPP
jgi:phosphatidylserine/phosphatidylglycerophosphate/cardiolipin synthase-like enzyme